MIRMNSITCKKIWVGPGVDGLVGEIEVEHWNDKNNTLIADEFISITWLDGSDYKITKNSIFEALNNGAELDVAAEFEHLSDTTTSEYYECFSFLEKLMNGFEGNFEKKPNITDAITKSNREQNFEFKSTNDYNFVLTNTFTYKRKTYIARVAAFSEDEIACMPNGIEFSLEDKKGKLIEGFDSLEDASESEFFMLYCDMNYDLRRRIAEHVDKNQQKLKNMSKDAFMNTVFDAD